ncbi:MAG: ABC transporter permease [candidate division WOR-3 bacterium]
MSFAVTVQLALRALRVHKLRSLLTMLGIIIGVGAVIAMLAIGQGASRSVQQQINALGSNAITILPNFGAAGGVRLGAGSAARTLTVEDAAAIAAECPDVAAVAPVVERGAQVVYENQNWATQIVGTTPDYIVVRNWPLIEGRYFTEEEAVGGTKVCVLGQTVVENLFPDQDPLGKTIRIRNIPFTVIGTLARRGQSFGGRDQDDEIDVPVVAAMRALSGRMPFIRIMASAADERRLDAAQEQITLLMRRRHQLTEGQDDDFRVRNMADLASTAQESSRVFTLLLASIASVSLLVGGIGIMNIMLVSVTERTREIGIRMAVGARGRDVLFQFLVEAIVISLVGGLLGMLFGVTASAIISSLAKWAVAIQPGSILLAFSFSAVVGVFFGFYPARRASSLDPIEALRYE